MFLIKGPWASCLAVSTVSPASCSSQPTGTSFFWTKPPGTITRTSMASSGFSSRSWMATDTGEMCCSVFGHVREFNRGATFKPVGLFVGQLMACGDPL